MAYFLVTPLFDLRHQLNFHFPSRSKTSDGWIGDTSHSAGSSSHNPDRTGNPEYADGDLNDEVRAIDVDKDLNRVGVTMSMVVKHLVNGAKAGRFPWLRYIIWNGTIWHINTGWEPRAYTGTNKHTEHAHINSGFNQSSDTKAGADYHFEELYDMALDTADKDYIKTTVENAVRTLVYPGWNQDAIQGYDPVTGAPIPTNPNDPKEHTMTAASALTLATSNARQANHRIGLVLDAVQALAQARSTEDVNDDAALEQVRKAVAEFRQQEVEAQAAMEALIAQQRAAIEAVPGTTVELLFDDTTPDQEAAEAIVNLIGDRPGLRAALLAELS